jgi:hypothetical protein
MTKQWVELIEWGERQSGELERKSRSGEGGRAGAWAYAPLPDTGATPCLPFFGGPGRVVRRAMPATQSRPGLLGRAGPVTTSAGPCHAWRGQTTGPRAGVGGPRAAYSYIDARIAFLAVLLTFVDDQHRNNNGRVSPSCSYTGERKTVTARMSHEPSLGGILGLPRALGF